MEFSRRSLMKMLGLTAAAPSLPGKALASATLTTATVAQAAVEASDELTGILKHGVEAVSGKRWKDFSDVEKEAYGFLEEIVWGSEDDEYSEKHIRPSLACFKSMSPAVKSHYEKRERLIAKRQRRVCERAMGMLYGNRP